MQLAWEREGNVHIWWGWLYKCLLSRCYTRTGIEISWGKYYICENMERDRNNLNTNSNPTKACQLYPMKSGNVNLIHCSTLTKKRHYMEIAVESLLLFWQEIHKLQLVAAHHCPLSHSYAIYNYDRSKCRVYSSNYWMHSTCSP